jgi:hypothetical protein
MIEGSESIPLTNGSGSGRPKNMWIRIRNTARKVKNKDATHLPLAGQRPTSRLLRLVDFGILVLLVVAGQHRIVRDVDVNNLHVTAELRIRIRDPVPF